MTDLFVDLVFHGLAHLLWKACSPPLTRAYEALPKWVRHGVSPDGFEWAVVREDEKRLRAASSCEKKVV